MNRSCDYGCGQDAIKVSANNKACCASHHSKCPAMKKANERSSDFYKERARKSAIAKKSKVNDQGLKVYEVSRAKGIQTRKDVKVNDPDRYKRAAASMVTTKKETFIDGKSIEERALDKWRVNRSVIGSDGLTSFERANRKRSYHLNQISDDQIHTNAQIYARKARDSRISQGEKLGIDPYAVSTAKAVQTRINDIDENGLNSFDRAFLKGWGKGIECKKYRDTSLYYQGSFELEFLERKVYELGSVELIKRGPAINYDFNGPKVYLSDFLIGNTIYEVKSQWTWWHTGKDFNLLRQNTAKLNAAVSAGYRVILVLDGEEISWPTDRWLDNSNQAN
jgi:hypothetical protein